MAASTFSGSSAAKLSSSTTTSAFCSRARASDEHSAALALDSREEGQPEIYVIANAAGAKPRRLTNHAAADILPSWSKDGKWVYFCSNRSGRNEIWRVPVEGGAPSQITRSGGHTAKISPDGSTLYFTRSANSFSSPWKIPAAGGDEVKVADGVARRGFAINPAGIYLVSEPSDTRHTVVRFLPAGSTESRVIARLNGDAWPGISVSQDNRFLYLSQTRRQGRDLWMAERVD